MLKLLIVLHRWIGVALCTLFLLWFPSGIGMMYLGMPVISARDRLERLPALDTFMLGGTALCGTSLVLAWRAVGRKLAGVSSPRVRQPRTALSEG